MNRQPNDRELPDGLEQTTDLPAVGPSEATPLPQRGTEKMLDTPVSDGRKRAERTQVQDTTPPDANDQTGDFILKQADTDIDRTGAYTPNDAGFADTKPPATAGNPGFPDVPGYEILAELGRGGMGVVYSAKQIALERVVALKMILSGPLASSEAIVRFDSEARAVAQLDHHNIVRIYDIGVYSPPGDPATILPYFSLEFVAGESLSKKIGRNPQAPTFAAQTVLALAKAMQYAHERGIIHRDLKPANVLLAEDGTVKLTDFGVAKRLGDEAGQTQSGQIVGTPSFMSPEQARGELDKLGPGADIYSLGAILYDMLTGHPPFTGTGVLNTLELVCTREPVPPGTVVKVPRDLDTICLKCLHKDPAKRYLAAADLADDLERFLDGRPIKARPVGVVEKSWRWAKRNPWVAGLSASVVALVVAVITVTSVMLYRLNDKNKELDHAYTEESLAKTKAQDEETKAKEALVKEAAALKTTAEQRQIGLEGLRNTLTSVDNVYRHDVRFAKMRLQIIERVLVDLNKYRDNARANPLEGRNESIAYQKLSDLFMRSQKIGDAVEWIRKARVLAQKLVAETPEDHILLHNAAGITHDCATLEWAAGNGATAREQHAEALAYRTTRLAVLTKNKAMAEQLVSAQQALADSYGLLAFTDLRLGEPATALEGYKESRRLLTTLPGDLGKRRLASFFGRRMLSENDIRTGDCEARLKNFTKAREHYKKAISAREELVFLTPKPPEPNFLARSDLAQAQLALADFELIFGSNALAASHGYHEALDSFNALLKQEPDNVDVQQGLAAIQYRMGYISGQRPTLGAVAGGLVEGLGPTYFEASLAIRSVLAKADPKDMQAQVEWMLTLARLGRAKEAEPLAELLLKQAGHDRQILFQTACGYAIMGAGPTGEAYRTKALDVLKLLVSKGWKDPVSLETDPDLESLRGDERLKALLK